MVVAISCTTQHNLALSPKLSLNSLRVYNWVQPTIHKFPFSCICPLTQQHTQPHSKTLHNKQPQIQMLRERTSTFSNHLDGKDHLAEKPV